MWKPALALTAALGAAAIAALVVPLPGPAGAQANPSAYATWTLTPAPPASTGTLAVPGTPVPDATFGTDGNGPSIPSGASTFLGPGTPFGAEFGGSRNRPYLSLGTAGLDPSTTTFTFASATPASGWGFAFGDIDADSVRVEAFAPDGAALPTSALGFRSVFNYCNDTPTPCSGGPHTDVPTWEPITGTLVGSGVDTSGAAGWFMPAAPIGRLRLTFSRLAGSPAMQMWVAGHLAPPPTTTTTSTTTSTSTSTTTPTTVAPTTTSVPPTSVAPPTTGPRPPAPPAPAAHAAAPDRHLPDTGAGYGTLPLLAAGLALLSLGLAAAHVARRRRTRPTR